ncbi:hypothetical protein JCM10213_004929 [Rhodosporidiobolus nylandii]
MRLSRLSLYGLVSTTLFVWTVVNAFRQRSNFYSAAVYLSKSNASLMILWNQGIFQTVLLGKFLQAVFLGELRLIEVERMQERGWFAVTETLLALTIFKDEFESSFVMLFVSLLFLKVFHWLASDRVEMMEQAARVTRLAHARMVGLLCLLWLADILFLIFAVDSILLEGPTVMIMFASEYMILLANIWQTSAKYALNVIDLRREEPWEEKSIYVFYVELAADFFKLVTYLSFFGLILTFYGLPLNILRDVYITLRSFLLKIRDLRRYRQATRNMDSLYPNATREEMAQMNDRTCIICREDMEYRPAPGERVEPDEEVEGVEGQQQPQQEQMDRHRGPNDTPKKLPCGHVFHFHCLRSWLERQQSCPTCRRPVLPNEQPAPQPAQAQPGGAAAGAPRPPAQANAAPGAAARNPADAAADEAIRQAQVNIARNLGQEAFGVIFPGIPFPPEAEGAAQGPAARLAQPPAAGGPTLAPPPVPARQQQDPAIRPAAAPASTPATSPAAGPSASAARPPATPTTPLPASPNPRAASPEQSARSPLLPSPTPSGGNGADNPLARFSLPNLPVPATGEAGLYHPPPSFAYPSSPSLAGDAGGYSNLAYGAYPQFGHHGVAGGLPPPAGSAQAMAVDGVVNVEERIREVRRRWVGASGEAAQVPVPEKAASTGPASGEEKERDNEAKEETKRDKGKAKAVDVEADGEDMSSEKGDTKEKAADGETSDDSSLSPREAALRAAERRLQKGKGKATAPSSSSPSSAPSAATSERPVPQASNSNETVVPPPAVAESSGLTHASPAARSLPRLIPLFDPSNPSPLAALSASYPSLFPSSASSSPSSVPAPLLSPQPSEEQLSELDRLATAGIEEKLRHLVGFQQRIEGLVGEMRQAIGSGGDELPRSGRGVAAEEQQTEEKVA